MANPQDLGYVVGEAGYYKVSDGSGPYNFDGNTTFSLIGSTTISGDLQVDVKAKANAAAPSFSEGSENQISSDLAGNLRAILAATENLIGFVAGKYASVSGTITRVANTTAYVSGQIIANNVTAGSVVPITLPVARANDKTGMIRRLRLKVNDTAWLNGVIRVHLYKDTPTFANGDGGNWAAGTTESSYLGYTDITLDRSFSDYVKGIGTPANGSEWNFEPSAGTQNIFAVLESRSGVTPGSAKVFTLVAEVLQN